MKIPLLILLLTTALSQAQDPFARNPNEPPPGPVAPGSPKVISMNFEIYSLPMAEAAALLRTATGDGSLYKELVARTAGGEGKLENLAAVRCMSGQRARAMGGSEQIYPTEYLGKVSKKPAEREKGAEIDPSTSHSDVVPALPGAFETRECGTILEVEPITDEKGSLIELRIVASHTAMTERLKWGQGLSQVDMPVFKSQKIDTGALTFTGQPCFLGTMSQPPDTKVIEASPKRVWFAFVTADFVKN